MRQYTVTGMTCAACQSHVEKAVAKVPGVSSVAVALLTNSMAVDGTASNEEIIRAVENAGYGARLKGEEKKRAPLQKNWHRKRKPWPTMKHRSSKGASYGLPYFLRSSCISPWGTICSAGLFPHFLTIIIWDLL